MEVGLPNDDCGTLAEKSSRTFVRSENTGRTGYSWSVMITPDGFCCISGLQGLQSVEHTCKLFRATTVIYMCNIVILLYTLPLALWGALCDSLREKGHELANGTFLVERER